MAPPIKAEDGRLNDSMRASAKGKNGPSGNKNNKGKPGTSSNPYGGLTSSLSSLFSPSPHGKDAALASLLANATPSKPKQAKFGLQSLEAPPSKKQKIKQESEEPKPLSPALSLLQPSKSKAPTPTATLTVSRISTPTPAPPALPPGRKPVFRPVLASPFAISWPDLPQADGHTILHRLLDFIRSLPAKPHVACAFGKTKHGPRGRDAKKARLEGKVSKAPSVEKSDWFVAGINSVTRTLEEHETDSSKITTVYVCRDDADPVALVAHFPMLCCSYNAKQRHFPLQLVPLPKGSEALLCQALGLKHCAVLALTDKCTFAPSLPPSCIVKAAWLESAILQPTRIKFLRSSAPTDLNGAKLAKKQKRQQRRKSKQHK